MLYYPLTSGAKLNSSDLRRQTASKLTCENKSYWITQISGWVIMSQGTLETKKGAVAYYF